MKKQHEIHNLRTIRSSSVRLITSTCRQLPIPLFPHRLELHALPSSRPLPHFPPLSHPTTPTHQNPSVPPNRRRNSPISLLSPSRLDTLTINPWRAMRRVLSLEGPLATLVVYVFEVEGVDVAGDVAVEVLALQGKG